MDLCAAALRPGWVAQFQGGTLTHLAIVALIGAVTALIVWMGRRCKGTVHEQAWNWFLRAGWLVIWLAWEARSLRPSHLSVRTSLPLYLCNIVAIAICLALWTRWRPARTLVVLMGIFLCSQALLTPPPMRGPGAILILDIFRQPRRVFGLGVYEVLVNDFRPTWRDWRLASFIALAYAVVVFPIDTMLEANYGYMGRWQPRAWVLADAAGPWPWRVIFMVAIAIGMMALAGGGNSDVAAGPRSRPECAATMRHAAITFTTRQAHPIDARIASGVHVRDGKWRNDADGVALRPSHLELFSRAVETTSGASGLSLRPSYQRDWSDRCAAPLSIAAPAIPKAATRV